MKGASTEMFLKIIYVVVALVVAGYMFGPLIHTQTDAFW